MIALLLLAWTSVALAAPTLQPTLQSLVALARGETSLDALLEKVGETYPELRRGAVLMHDSRSRQAASYEYPRVIAFTPDARFILAFNGDPKAEGYDELEMIEFGPESANSARPGRQEGFRFQRIHFAPGRPAEPGPVNEPLCLKCHGDDPRPNWESYHIWEGTYFHDDYERSGERFRLGYHTEAEAGFGRFYDRQAGRGRYRFLADVDEQYLLGGGRRRIAPSQFTQVVAYLNYRRLAHRILATPEYARYKFAILGALYDCPDYAGFLPADYARKAGPLSAVIDDTKRRFEADANRFLLRHHHEQAGKLRYVFEGRGIPMHRWSMSFRRDPYQLVTPGGDPGGFLSSILMEYDPALAPYRLYRETGDYGISVDFVKEWKGSWTAMSAPECAALRTASQRALGAAGRN